MPTISQFYGLSIRMYLDDHPPPHFHAYYAEDVAKIEIATLEVTDGELPRRAQNLSVNGQPNIVKNCSTIGGVLNNMPRFDQFHRYK